MNSVAFNMMTKYKHKDNNKMMSSLSITYLLSLVNKTLTVHVLESRRMGGRGEGGWVGEGGREVDHMHPTSKPRTLKVVSPN